jgi:hypothetical protein
MDSLAGLGNNATIRHRHEVTMDAEIDDLMKRLAAVNAKTQRAELLAACQSALPILRYLMECRSVAAANASDLGTLARCLAATQSAQPGTAATART